MSVGSGFDRMYKLFLVENVGAEYQFRRVPQEFIVNVLVKIIAESVIYFFVCLLGSWRGGLGWPDLVPGPRPAPHAAAPRPGRPAINNYF